MAEMSAGFGLVPAGSRSGPVSLLVLAGIAEKCSRRRGRVAVYVDHWVARESLQGSRECCQNRWKFSCRRHSVRRVAETRRRRRRHCHDLRKAAGSGHRHSDLPKLHATGPWMEHAAVTVAELAAKLVAGLAVDGLRCCSTRYLPAVVVVPRAWESHYRRRRQLPSSDGHSSSMVMCNGFEAGSEK